MKQKTLTSLSVAAALGLLTPLPGYAFGLGQITLYSALNEPFRAEIEVNALQDDEQGNLEVRLGSSQDFERAGLERSFLLTQLNFEVIEESDSTRILVTSDIPIKEPFLGFLLAATTGQGKLLREYTVLLDPPKELYRGRDTVESSRAPVSQSTVPATPRTTSPSRTASASDRVTQYNVQSRDTLWSIAERTRPSGDITMQQMMIGLLNANPRAFQQDNVNSLYAGSTLRIPATEEITRLSANEAKAAVDRQNLEWQQRNLAQTASPVAIVDDISTSENNAAAENNEIEPEIEAANDAEDPANLTESGEAISDAESARLKLIAATENSLLEADPEINGDPDLQRISEQLTLAQETIESQTQENIDFKNRMDAMERQLDTMRRLISLKDADMARLQSLLEQDETQMDLATLVDEANTILENSEADSEALNDGDNNTNLDDPSEEATNPDVVDDDWQPVDIANVETDAALTEEEASPTESNDNIADESTELETVTNADSPELTASELDENTVEASETAELETAAGEVDAAIVEAAQELNLDQQQLDSLYQRVQAFVIAHKVESLLAILLLLLIIWMIIRRGQREVSWDDAVSKINKNKPATTTAETGSVNIVTPVAEEKESTTASQTKSVDELVEQADMFVGYADYVQAGTALEQAHRQAPEDKEITAKLLFIYYKQQKSADFIALLNTSGIDENDPQWPDVRNWGAQLLPHNPLFAESSEAAEVTIEESTEEVQTSLDTEDEPQGDVETEEEVMETSSEPEESDHIDFNLDDYKTDSTTTSKTEEVYQRDEEDLLQFDSSTSAEKDSEAELEQSETDTYPEDDDLRIDFEQDNVLQPDSSAPEVLDLNIDETDDVSDQQPEEVLSVDSLDADELDLTNFETEEPTETEDVDVIEDYLNLDSSADDDELDFDLSDFDSIDESETKLDLAAAYSDMGDPEGARGILEEVLEQGTDEQKKRAQELLDTLS